MTNKGLPQMCWGQLNGEPMPPNADGANQSLFPRHFTTPDCSLHDALALWEGSLPGWLGLPSGAPALPYVYLRGALPPHEAVSLLTGSVFEALLGTAIFGTRPFCATLYLSHQGLQTNLHADEHSGFLVQMYGRKRVVLIRKRDAKSLRCLDWGKIDAPVNRRSWFDDGVPDAPGWQHLPPLSGIPCQEVEVGPNEALFIPKGWFHDILSRDAETMGLVLRCSA